MALTPIGGVITPTNFLVTSAQSLVNLTWSAQPLVLSYFVLRSTDNVTFTSIGSSAGTFFNDSTAVVGTIYYYQIQSFNGTAYSFPTTSQSALALAAGDTTLGNLILQCQQRTDRVTSDNITDQEWSTMITSSYKELYDILIQKFGCDYYIAPPFSYTTTGQLDPVYQAQVFPLPTDFYKLMRCEVALNPNDPNSWVTLRQFEAIQANLWNFPNVYTFYGITNLRYRLWGEFLQLVPIASAGQTIRIWYSPKPSQLLNATDIVKAISGWEEYIVVDVCMKALAKTEEEVNVFMMQKAALVKRIEEAAQNRNVGEPQTVSDARTRNFSWSDSGSEFSGGSGMY